MASLYFYYYQYFISFFLVSGFNYTNLHLIPRIAKIKYFFSFFNYKRLNHIRDFQYVAFLLISSLRSQRFQLKTTLKEKFPRYIFKIIFDKSKNLFDTYERFVFFNYAGYHINPITTQYNSNNNFLVKCRGYRVPETALFRPGARYTENIYDLRQRLFVQFCISPKKQYNLFGKRALLRLLNLPLQNRYFK